MRNVTFPTRSSEQPSTTIQHSTVIYDQQTKVCTPKLRADKVSRILYANFWSPAFWLSFARSNRSHSLRYGSFCILSICELFNNPECDFEYKIIDNFLAPSAIHIVVACGGTPRASGVVETEPSFVPRAGFRVPIDIRHRTLIAVPSIRVVRSVPATSS